MNERSHLRDRRIRALFLLSAAAMLAYCATHLEFSTDVTNFMPRESSAELAVLASRLADSELTRTMILTVGGADPESSQAAARALAERMRTHPEVAWLRSGVDADPIEEVYRLYFPRRHRFLSDRPEQEIPELTSPESLRRRAREARRALAGPTAALTKRLVPADPLGAFERVLLRLRDQRPRLEVRAGQFTTPDGRWAVIFLATRASAFDSKPQAELLADLHAAFAEVAADHGEDLVLEVSGANRFAVAAERSIRSDVMLIAAASFAGVALVFLAFLRSVHFFGLAVLPPLAGILAATTATRLAFGRLDGLTMAFGASLIGVAIDYSIHVLNHHRLNPNATPDRTVRRLRPSLVLGALTTMASFAGLALTSFPGFREIGVFAITGVGISLAVTLFVLPAFLGSTAEKRRTIPPLAESVARRMADGLRFLARRRGALVALALGCAAATAFFVPDMRFDDDLSHLMALDPELRAEEERVRDRVVPVEAGRVVFALGSDSDDVLALNGRVAQRLETAQRGGALEGFHSLHGLIWSRELQERNLRSLEAVPDLADRVETAFTAEGFRPEAVAPFREALEGPPSSPLDIETLRASALGGLVSSLFIDLGDRVAAVTHLRGVHSPEALVEALDGLEHVHLFDQRTFVNEIYREFRATTLRQMAVGSVLVVLVLGARYRRWRPALAAFLPSLLVAGILLAGFAAFDVGINLLHVTSLILVMGMGVDYGIFIVDSAGERRHLEATLLSLLLACLTTVFVFGTLALSQHPALRAIGVTTATGVLLSFLLAPVTLALVRDEHSEHAT